MNARSNKKSSLQLGAEFAVCPYENSHIVLKLRLAVHLVRCAKNFPDSKLIRCPYNITHVLQASDLLGHTMQCESVEVQEPVMKMIWSKDPRDCSVPPIACSENWDDEPPAATYDPNSYCEKQPIMRQIYIVSKKNREVFRRAERKRVKALLSMKKHGN